MKNTINKFASWAAGITAFAGTFGMSGCEEAGVRPDPVNLEYYDVTELNLEFDQFGQLGYVSFLATKPEGSECTNNVQSVMEYEMFISQSAFDDEVAAFTGFDFYMDEYRPRDVFGNGSISGKLAVEANSLQNYFTLGLRDCARTPDAMVLMMENALIVTNAVDSVEARQLLGRNDIRDDEGNTTGREDYVTSRGPVFTSGDFTPGL